MIFPKYLHSAAGAGDTNVIFRCSDTKELWDRRAFGPVYRGHYQYVCYSGYLCSALVSFPAINRGAAPDHFQRSPENFSIRRVFILPFRNDFFPFRYFFFTVSLAMTWCFKWCLWRKWMRVWSRFFVACFCFFGLMMNYLVCLNRNRLLSFWIFIGEVKLCILQLDVNLFVWF